MDTETTKAIVDTISSNSIIIAILSSSLLAAFIASIVNGLFSISLKKREYQYIFFQEVIKKRIEAYEFIESQIAVLTSSAVDENGKAYHLIFAFGEDEFYDLQKNMAFAKAKGVWIGGKTNALLTEMNYLFLKISNEYDLTHQLEDAGKQNYKQIAYLRTKLEASFIKDISTLHNVKEFLNKKANIKASYNLVQLNKNNDKTKHSLRV